MNEEMIKILKYLHLGGLLAHWDEYLTLAQRQRFSHVKLLNYVLEEEQKLRRDNARRLRLKRAHIPELLDISTYPFDRQPNLDRKKIIGLYDGFDYMTKVQNIVWMGPSGCGKTGLASSFLIHAINRGYTGRFVTFPALIQELFASIADHSESKTLKQYQSYDCLVIDEIGYVEVEPVQLGLFFTLLQQRHHRKPTLITSNLGFDDWRTFFKNDHLTAALIDRLTENSHIFNMKKCRTLRPKLDQES